MQKIKSLFFIVSVLLIPKSSVIAVTPGEGNPSGGVSPGAGNPSPQPMGLTNPLRNIDTLPEFLNAILSAVVQIGIIILIMMLVYVGFKFVMARGNPEELSGAKSALMWTIIGGFVLLGAQAIGLVIQETVGAL